MAKNNVEVRVYPIDEPKNNTLAFANVSIDDMTAIRGIRVVDGKNGLFVTMPQSKSVSGKYHDIAFPLNGELRKEINAAVLGEFKVQESLEPNLRGYEKREMEPGNGISIDDIKLDVRVFPFKEPTGNVLAYASATFNDIIAIRGIRVVNSDKGPFIAMPQSKGKDGKYYDIAFPINGDLRKEISQAILTEYNSAQKSHDKKPSIADGIREGAKQVAKQKAAKQQAAEKKMESKTKVGAR